MSLTLVCLPSTYFTTPMRDHWGCTRILFLECAADGVFESHFKSHTESVLIADKNYRIAREEDSTILKSILMIGFRLVVMVRPKARP